MESIRVKYSKISPRRQAFIDKFQLLLASVGIYVGYIETLDIYKGIWIVLPILGFAIAILNILLVIFYKRFINLYGDTFQKIMLQTNGVILLLTGVGYHISGSHYLQYAYYILALFYLILLPRFILLAQNEKVIVLDESQISVRRKFKTTNYLWKNLDHVNIQNTVLSVREKGKMKVRKYFLEQDEEKRAIISEFIGDLEKVNREKQVV